MMLILFLSLFLQTAGSAVTPPSVLSANAPVSPYGVIQGGVALADLTVSSSGNVERTALLQGSSPFSEETLRVVASWRFLPAQLANRPTASHVGVLTVFRPAALGNFGVGGSSLGFQKPIVAKSDHSALPETISDPGYPQNSIAEGTVVIEVTIDKTGHPSGTRVIQDIPGLTEPSRFAVRNWRFLPAVDSGETVEGKIVVAIVYQRPV